MRNGIAVLGRDLFHCGYRRCSIWRNENGAVRWYKRQVRSNVYLPRKPERQKHHVPLDTARYADYHHVGAVLSAVFAAALDWIVPGVLIGVFAFLTLAIPITN
ncbi:MAG: hypothetical protein ACLTW9_22270 [Enterocloster sp.]